MHSAYLVLLIGRKSLRVEGALLSSERHPTIDHNKFFAAIGGTWTGESFEEACNRAKLCLYSEESCIPRAVALMASH